MSFESNLHAICLQLHAHSLDVDIAYQQLLTLVSQYVKQQNVKQTFDEWVHDCLIQSKLINSKHPDEISKICRKFVDQLVVFMQHLKDKKIGFQRKNQLSELIANFLEIHLWTVIQHPNHQQIFDEIWSKLMDCMMNCIDIRWFLALIWSFYNYHPDTIHLPFHQNHLHLHQQKQGSSRDNLYLLQRILNKQRHNCALLLDAIQQQDLHKVKQYISRKVAFNVTIIPILVQQTQSDVIQYILQSLPIDYHHLFMQHILFNNHSVLLQDEKLALFVGKLIPHEILCLFPPPLDEARNTNYEVPALAMRFYNFYKALFQLQKASFDAVNLRDWVQYFDELGLYPREVKDTFGFLFQA